MQYTTSYRYRLVPPNLKIDSRKKKNEWKEFVEYIDNFKLLVKNGKENEQLKECENKDYQDVQYYSDISETINNIIKIKKWNKTEECRKREIAEDTEYEIEDDTEKEFVEDYEKEDEEEEEEEEENDEADEDYENEKHFKMGNESDSGGLNFITYNLVDNNIYSNSTNYKNVIPEKKFYNYPPTSTKYQTKENGRNKEDNNIRITKKGNKQRGNKQKGNEQKGKGNMKKGNIKYRSNTDIPLDFELTHTEKKNAFLKENNQANINNNRNIDVMSGKTQSVYNSIEKKDRSSDPNFVCVNEKMREEYEADKQQWQHEEQKQQQEYRENVLFSENHNHWKNTKTLPPLSVSSPLSISPQLSVVPPFRIPRKTNDDGINYNKENSSELRSINIIDDDSSEHTKTAMEVPTIFTNNWNKRNWAETDSKKYKSSEYNIKNINKRKDSYLTVPKNKKGSGKQTKNNYKMNKSKFANKKMKTTNLSKNNKMNKWKKNEKEKKVEIDGSYAYNYAYLKDDSDTSSDFSSSEDENTRNNMLTDIQEEMEKYFIRNIN